MTQAEMVNNSIQRGIARAVIRDGEICIEPTAEGNMIRFHMEHNEPIPCMKCGSPYPKARVLPKYSLCPECRKGTMPVVDFIQRPY